MQLLGNRQQFKDFITNNNKDDNVKLVHFWADWSESCKQLDMLLTELGKEYGRSFEAAILDAEGIPEISAEYGISAVPTVVAFQNGNVVSKIEGYHPSKLKDLVINSTFAAIPPAMKENKFERDVVETTKEDLDSRLKRLITKARMTLFMKGSPESPKCGFSRQIIDLLRQHNVDFWTFDILCDEQVRQRLKEYSDWPTYPQLYLDGELLGGLDVIREELKDPTFVQKLPKLS